MTTLFLILLVVRDKIKRINTCGTFGRDVLIERRYSRGDMWRDRLISELWWTRTEGVPHGYDRGPQDSIFLISI